MLTLVFNILWKTKGAEASVDLMILHSTKEYCRPFRVMDYSVQVFDSDLDPAYRSLERNITKSGKKFGPTARATVQLQSASGVRSFYTLLFDEK